MSETSSGGSVPSSLPQCKYCSTPLPAINTPFCGECGKAQMEMKRCIRCQMELPVSTKFCFRCSQDQSQPLPRKPCLLCGAPLLANAQNCLFCSAPQDPQVMQSVQLKYCHNRNCQTALMYSLTVCYKCRSPQLMPPPMHLLIKAKLPNPHYPQLPYVFPPATPLPMTPEMQSQAGQMHYFPVYRHPTMTDQRLSGQQIHPEFMHQLLPSPQPLPTQPVGDTTRWEQMPEVIVDYQSPHSNASITSLPPTPTSETHSQSQISIPIQVSTTLFSFFLLYFEKQRHSSRKGLSETDQHICYAAINSFKGVCSSVLDGTVTSDLLKKLKEKKEQVQKLCEAITFESHEESGTPLSPDHFTYEAINTALDERLKEYNYFLEYHQKLKHICNHLDGLSIQGNYVYTCNIYIYYTYSYHIPIAKTHN